jgi:hypothetical protein
VKFLLSLVAILIAAAIGLRTYGTQTDVPDAGYAIARAVLDERKQAALKSQETRQGYVIDPALADRILADSGLVVRKVAVRGMSPNKVGRAEIEAPDDGGPRRTVRYFNLALTPPSDWKVVSPATELEWHLKVW